MTTPELDIIDLPTEEQILLLQSEVGKLPQAEFETEHLFSDGMYCRKIFIGPGCLVVGKTHKKDHFFMCILGEVRIGTTRGIETMRAGDVLESKAGTKRVVFSKNGCILVTMHRTDKKDLDEIEKEFIESEPNSLFDSANKLKMKEIS